MLSHRPSRCQEMALCSWPQHVHPAALLRQKADYMRQRNWELYSGTALRLALSDSTGLILLVFQLESNKIWIPPVSLLQLLTKEAVCSKQSFQILTPFLSQCTVKGISADLQQLLTHCSTDMLRGRSSDTTAPTQRDLQLTLHQAMPTNLCLAGTL